MMTEISLNILDIAENSHPRPGFAHHDQRPCGHESGQAGRDHRGQWLRHDPGAGRTRGGPFYTTRSTRKVGLGVPFFKMAALSAGGDFSIWSEPGKGTIVYAQFGLSNIDRMPLGDISGTIHTLIVFNQNIDFVYNYQYDDKSFTLDTREFRQILGDVPFDTPEVSQYILDYLKENRQDTDGGAEV